MTTFRKQFDFYNYSDFATNFPKEIVDLLFLSPVLGVHEYKISLQQI